MTKMEKDELMKYKSMNKFDRVGTEVIFKGKSPDEINLMELLDSTASTSTKYGDRSPGEWLNSPASLRVSNYTSEDVESCLKHISGTSHEDTNLSQYEVLCSQPGDWEFEGMLENDMISCRNMPWVTHSFHLIYIGAKVGCNDGVAHGVPDGQGAGFIIWYL